MKLGWNVSEELQQLPSREIVRNCGQLLGRLDYLLPCLYIAQYGASIVSRGALAAALKTELIRFFTTEFDPLHWDSHGDSEADDDHVPLKDTMLNDLWLYKSTSPLLDCNPFHDSAND